MTHSSSNSRPLEQTEFVDALTFAKLVFTEGPRKGEELTLQASELTLGRSRKADVFLEDERLSRIHAKIMRTAAGYRLIDLNSRNGTLVNNVRVLEHLLTSYDVISLGDSKIMFFILELSAVGTAGSETISLVPVAIPHENRIVVAPPPPVEYLPAARFDGSYPAWVAAAVLAGLLLFPKHDYSPAPKTRVVAPVLVPLAPVVDVDPPKKITEALKAALDNPKQDLMIYLEDGKTALEGEDYERAADNFQSALTIDPTNEKAIQGLELAEKKGKVEPTMDAEQEKRRLVAELFNKAASDMKERRYRSAMLNAQKIRDIELKGETTYLNEAKQILDRAQMQQREEFDPFLIRAKETFAEGNYSTTRDLAEEILKKDSDYEEARLLLKKTNEELTVLAKQAFDYGYVLESMNLKGEADQYYRRVFNYTREGDDYYSKATEKLKRIR